MQTSAYQQIKASNIGNIAFTSLSTDQEGFVLGNTSKGLFINNSGKWLNFISTEQFRGPLTINVSETNTILQHIPSQSPVQISSRTLIFPDAGIEICTQESIVWQSPLPNELPLPQSERKERLRESANEIISANNNGGITSLLPYVHGDQSSNRSYFMRQSSLHNKIVLLHEQIQRKTNLPSSNSLINLLGAGNGLTPSGDDFIIGLLLSFNRWENVLVPGQDLQKLNQQVVEAAYKKTSLLSANLIECAARGQADERLIDSLDWLVSGLSQESSCLDDLVDWGNSSGGDVFVGFAVALSLQKDLN